jgi:serine/threonine protein kinase
MCGVLVSIGCCRSLVAFIVSSLLQFSPYFGLENVCTGAVIERRTEPMLVMEYMEYGSLYDLLHNDTIVIDGELLLPILRDVAQGMRFLHASEPKVIHGDLKTQNILVDSKFRAKVADFGLSQKKNVIGSGTRKSKPPSQIYVCGDVRLLFLLLGQYHELLLRGSLHVTQNDTKWTHTVSLNSRFKRVTAYWMSPELLRGESNSTAASDVYAFGICLYEVYSRRDPYEGENPREVLRLVADKKINMRPPVPDNCPARVQALMEDCLVMDPDQRPTFKELDQRLKRADAQNIDPCRRGDDLCEGGRRKSISLFDIFPKHVAESLRDGKKVEPEHRDCVTILFCDIVGFTDISASLDPRKVANLLDRLYHKFDDLSGEHDVFKVSN